MTLPKAISDAIDAYRDAVEWTQDDARQHEHAESKEAARVARAALERAIAEHVASVRNDDDAGKAAGWDQATQDMDDAGVPPASFPSRVRWLIEHVAPVAAPTDDFPNDGKLHAILRGSVEVNGRKFAYTGTVRNWKTIPGDKPPTLGPIYEIEALNLPFRQDWATGVGENVADAEASLRQVLANIMAAEPKGDAPAEAEIEAWERRTRDLLKSSGLRVRATLIREDGTPTGEELDSPPLAYVLMLREGVALMRRAAASKPFYGPKGKGGTHDLAMHIDPAGTVRGVTFTLTDKTTGVVTRYVPEQAAAKPSDDAHAALQGIATALATAVGAEECPPVTAGNLHAVVDECLARVRRLAHAAATPAPSALDRLRERVQLVAGGRDEKKRLIWDEATRGAMQRVLEWIDEEKAKAGEAKR